MAIFLNNAPFSEEGAKLELTAEMEENCKVVYKLDDEGGAAFAGFWNPEAEYTEEYAILPVRSTFGGTERLDAGKEFANVFGSSEDTVKGIPEGAGSWIKLYENHICPTKKLNRENCCTDTFIYNKKTGVKYENNVILDGDDTGKPFVCGCNSKHNIPLYHNGIVGGHITIGRENRSNEAIKLKNIDVYILPICRNHNVCRINPSGSPGIGYYMKLKEDTLAVTLTGYLLPPQLQTMLKGMNEAGNTD